MDVITTAIATMNNSLITSLSLLFHSELNMIVIMAVLLVATTLLFNEKKKIPLLLLTLLIGFAVAWLVKGAYVSVRPCVFLPAKVECPGGYSFPSGHAFGAFSFAAVMMGSASFPLYFLIALFVSFSRVYLGVHTFMDIAASLAIAVGSRHIAERILKNVML